MQSVYILRKYLYLRLTTITETVFTLPPAVFCIFKYLLSDKDIAVNVF